MCVCITCKCLSIFIAKCLSIYLSIYIARASALSLHTYMHTYIIKCVCAWDVRESAERECDETEAMTKARESKSVGSLATTFKAPTTQLPST
jgi:hypothetical protein